MRRSQTLHQPSEKLRKPRLGERAAEVDRPDRPRVASTRYRPALLEPLRCGARRRSTNHQRSFGNHDLANAQLRLIVPTAHGWPPPVTVPHCLNPSDAALADAPPTIRGASETTTWRTRS